MLDANSKADIFLSSIKKYAVQQSDMLHDEAEQFKEKELQRIKNNAIEEANAMIARETAAIKASIAGETAQKYEDSRVALFEKRKNLTDNVYKAAQKKLSAFTLSDNYNDYLQTSIKKAAAFIGEKSVVIYIKPDDKKHEHIFSDAFKNILSFEYSDEIKIGGFKLYCPEIRIIVDETLDEKLKNTREWFVENSNLKIL